MAGARAVVIPFGVPEDGRGLGLGLAALVHAFAQIAGESVALAQLLSRRESAGSPSAAASASRPDPETGPVEAFVPPHAWKDIAGGSASPAAVSFVVTGAFEPPTEGRGLIQLLAFDAHDGRTKARVEAPVDGDNAGSTLIAALDELWTDLDGELGGVRDIGGLSWDALESVLRAERCALHDPMRGGPYDRLAAMVHLSRAIGDAPCAQFPASRLAALALDVAVASPTDPKLAAAALRALTHAIGDAPTSPDLVEATAALCLRLGQGEAAEAQARTAIALEPDRARLYALLSEARRSRGDLEGALTAIEDGLLHGADDPLLNTERGIVLAERGNLVEAERAWRMVLSARPLYPPAFTNLASLVMDRRDSVAATQLVDEALMVDVGHPEVLRRAIQLSLTIEPEGLARAARVGKLAESLVSRSPTDAWGVLVLARSLARMGDRSGAIGRLAQVETMAPLSTLASEAQRGRHALEAPESAREIDAVLRAAYNANPIDLDAIAERARRLALAHPVWPAFFAVGIAERRREQWQLARAAFESAIRVSPGCAPAHLEVVAAHVALGDAELAVEHAERACALDGQTARSLAVLATAFLAAGRRDEAMSAIDRALALDDSDESNRALAERIRSSPPPSSRFARSTLARLRDIFAGPSDRRFGRIAWWRRR